jgi:hypothetical protein
VGSVGDVITSSHITAAAAAAAAAAASSSLTMAVGITSTITSNSLSGSSNSTSISSSSAHNNSFASTSHQSVGTSISSNPSPIALYLSAASNSGGTLSFRAALWALGHIGSTDLGYAAITEIYPAFLDWCIIQATTSSCFSLRGVCFFVLGLLSRTDKGNKRLAQAGWEAAPNPRAVAVPKNPSDLFKISMTSFMGSPCELNRLITGNNSASNSNSNLQGMTVSPAISGELAGSSSPPTASSSSSSLSLFPNNKNYSIHTIAQRFNLNEPEELVLNLIAKLPGRVYFDESMDVLKSIQASNPQVFTSRDLYIAVHSVIGEFSYKLSHRRVVLEMFSVNARSKNSAGNPPNSV